MSCRVTDWASTASGGVAGCCALPAQPARKHAPSIRLTATTPRGLIFLLYLKDGRAPVHPLRVRALSTYVRRDSKDSILRKRRERWAQLAKWATMPAKLEV